MRICVVGGGPGGLYFALSAKLKMPWCSIDLFEQNDGDRSIGWGVVFSGRMIETLRANDQISGNRLLEQFVQWDTIQTQFGKQLTTSEGFPFNGIDRRKLVRILRKRCLDLGINLHVDHKVCPKQGSFESFDLIVAADGVNSDFRSHHAERLGASERIGTNKYIWLGANKQFDRFHFEFRTAGDNWIWAHAYPFDKCMSTFIVECTRNSWETLGFAHHSCGERNEKLSAIFSHLLDGGVLLDQFRGSSEANWDQFRQVHCEQWSIDNIVLIGDAAHTIHFSIGSGTKQAFDDGICLTKSLQNSNTVIEAIKTYQDKRRTELQSLQTKGSRSMYWFEHIDDYDSSMNVIDFETELLRRASSETSCT